MNTGSPEAPEEVAVRSYLKAFLMDPLVIDLPKPLRAGLVHGLILPRRPAKTAKAYQEIWTKNGSPLVHYGKQLAKELGVEVGMAYGQPSFNEAVERLLATGVDEIRLLPLFPHYAMATVGSCVRGVKKAIRNRAALRVVPPFYNHPAFIRPLAESVADADEHILLSYHGLPLRHLKKRGVPDYRVQCGETTRGIIDKAGIAAGAYSVSFQSRMGRTKWMEPYTEELLKKLPSLGKTRLAVLCPSFFCDGLETLGEIEIHGRKLFMDAGGESFRTIPCLNTSPAAFECLETLMSESQRWPIVP